ncbi:MAG: RIP metalloprotease RseP [Clostridiales bacterium]|nr:RIP metalloprotease RseP [Clostridiales bacterium]
METFFIKAVQLVLALALLIIIHEGGHYFFARVFGIKVEKFYLFFDPWFSLASWKPKPRKTPKLDKDGKPRATWRDTRYGIGWIPLGGYVKIAGMIDESMDKEQMAQPAQSWEFRSKPAWQRLLVMIGGVLMNFLLAIFIYICIAWYWGAPSVPFERAYLGFDYAPQAIEAGFRNGDIPIAANGQKLEASDPNCLVNMIMADKVTVLRNNTDTVVIDMPENFPLSLSDSIPFIAMRQPVVVQTVMNGEPAADAGLIPGDRMLAVGGTDAQDYATFSRCLLENAGKEVELTLLRDNDTLKVAATPSAAGKLGFQLANPYDVYGYDNIRYTFLESIPVGVGNGVDKLTGYVKSLKYVFTKEGAKSVGGFGAIGSLFPEKWNWRTFWEMAAFLSIILAFMNILPIPALDGGHVVFVLWEIITRRKPSEKVLEQAQIIGMCLLFALLIYANFNDIYRFLIK